MNTNPTTITFSSQMAEVINSVIDSLLRDEREGGLLSLIDRHIETVIDEPVFMFAGVEDWQATETLTCSNPACSDPVPIPADYWDLLDEFTDAHDVVNVIDLCIDCYQALGGLLAMQDEGPDLLPCFGCGAEWSEPDPVDRHRMMYHAHGCLDLAWERYDDIADRWPRETIEAGSWCADCNATGVDHTHVCPATTGLMANIATYNAEVKRHVQESIRRTNGTADA